MSTLYKYDKDGNEIQSYTTNLPGGSGCDIQYIDDSFNWNGDPSENRGSGHFIGCQDRILALFYLTPIALQRIRIVLNIGAQNDLFGCTYNGKDIIFFNVPTAIPQRWNFSQIDWQGNQTATELLSSTTNEQALCFDGLLYYAARSNGRIKVIYWDGTTATIIRNFNLSGTISGLRGICYDGVNFWVNNTDTCALVVRTPDTGMDVTKTFSIQTGSRGMTTDGQFLYIMNDT